MNFIKRIFTRKVATTSNLAWEKLTEHELNFVRKNAKCPDCKNGDLLQGPSAGVCINVLCSNENCSSRFNLTLTNGLEIAERITDRAPGAKFS